LIADKFFEDMDMVIRSLLARSFDLVKDSAEEFIGDSVLSLLVEMESFFIFINSFICSSLAGF